MSVTYARGFTAGAVACGIKTGKAERLDLAVIVSSSPCSAAALFTTNQVVAAPIVVTRRHLAAARPRAIVANSGNANACTGDRGERDAEAMAAAAGRVVGARPEEVLVASTGVIGVPLPVERIAAGLEKLRLVDDGADAARAILTTDTRPKTAGRDVMLAGGLVRIGGMAKGAGMIHPDLATMLVFITTDLSASPAYLDASLRAAAADSVQAISIDGDTSTNDTVLLLANGVSGVTPDGAEDAGRFASALGEVCVELARAIVSDGEGATKVFEVRVSGARSVEDARRAARTVASSNLVKTAIHGADPNWGRILAAAGRSGARVDDRRASVRVGGYHVYREGAPCGFDGDTIRGVLRQAEIVIDLDLALGDGSARAWGCDLSAEYVRVNAEYTT